MCDVVMNGWPVPYLNFMFDFQHGGRLESTTCYCQGICFAVLIPWDGGDIESVKNVINYVPHIIPI